MFCCEEFDTDHARITNVKDRSCFHIWPRGVLQAKPAEKERWLNKVALDGGLGQARLHTGKISIGGFLRLQLVAAASRANGVQLFWRCAEGLGFRTPVRLFRRRAGRLTV